MNPADLARQNAIPLEVKKDGLQQRQNGDWVLRFVVQAADMDQRLTSAPMGTRFQVALVEIDDSEMPVSPAAKEPAATPEVAQPPSPAKRTASGEASSRSRMDWRELQPAAQAGIRCADPVFWKFLEEQDGCETSNADEAANVVRFLCQVKSRSELSTDHRKRVLWHQLDSQFLAWKELERT